jgi:hypothetical protein
MTNEVKTLIEKAAKAEKSEDAMRFSQAAVNVTNAILWFNKEGNRD